MSDLLPDHKVHPTRFEREVHNAAAWMYLPTTSLGAAKAAKFLGLGYYALLKNVDLFGLTVLFRNRKGTTGRVDKYFLKSELINLKHKLESVTMKDALMSAEASDEYLAKIRNRKRKIRAIGKGRAG